MCVYERERTVGVKMSEVQVSLAGLVQLHGVGLWGAQQVEASQGITRQRRGGLCCAAHPLSQEAALSRVLAGVALEDGCFWPAGGDSEATVNQIPGQKHKNNL